MDEHARVQHDLGKTSYVCDRLSWNRQAWKNAERTKVGMAEFELRLNVDNYT